MCEEKVCDGRGGKGWEGGESEEYVRGEGREGA